MPNERPATVEFDPGKPQPITIRHAAHGDMKPMGYGLTLRSAREIRDQLNALDLADPDLDKRAQEWLDKQPIPASITMLGFAHRLLSAYKAGANGDG